MHGQRNHTNQVGQDFYAPRPTFQQHPPAAALPPPPPPSHRGPFTPQLHVFQQGRPYFHPTSGISSFQNSLPSVPHQGASAPVVSSGRSSAQSYVSHTQNPQVHVSNQTYQTPEQRLPWSQNVYPSPYPLPSSQGHIQYPSHAPPPPFLPYSSSSSFLISDPCGSSTLAFRKHWPLPPPPPPPRPCPPPLPTYSPPRVPPLPPSSPQSDVLSTNDGSRSLKDLVEGANLIVEHPPQAKPAEDRNVHQNEIPCHGHTENNGPKLKSIDAVVDHSSGVSDMEMEDDITHDVEEKNGCLSTNSNGGCTSISQEDYVKDQLQDLQHSGEHRVPTEALHENLLVAEASILKDHTGGMAKNRRIELPLDASVNGSSSQHKFTSQPSVPVACEETGFGKLSGQLMEGANPFNLLQGYASGDLSENDCENLLVDINSPARLNVRSSTSDDQKVCNFRSKVRVEDLLESNKHMPPKSMVESPRNVTEADELSSATGIFEKLYDKICRGQEFITTSAAVQPKTSSRNCDAYIEGANDYKQDTKVNLTEMKVDEFGRLVRDGPSDSDTSDSPHYTQRHAKRARKRSSSRSRSRSPHDRRRRRPGRRNGRRGRSRSSSPKRRRSRSRSPVLKRNTEFSGDKQKREKSQLTECFDFIRGKCYRGSSCRYLHHETDKSDRLRYSRGKHQSTLRSPDVGEGKVLYDKEIKDKGLPQDMLKLREVRDSKELTVDLCTHPVADVENSHLSVYSVHGMDSGNGNALMLESPAQYSDEMTQIADQQGKRVGDSLVSESSSLVQASADASAHLSADKPDEKSGPTCQLLPFESPISKKPFPIEEVESQSLKQLPASVANHPFKFNLPLPPVSQLTSAPSGQDYNLMPPSARFHSTLENHTPYQTPVSYQHSHIPEQSNSLANSFLPPPPPPPHHLSVSVKHGEHGNHSQHTQQFLQPAWDGLPSYTDIRDQPNELFNRFQSFQYQIYPLLQEPDQILIPTENLASSSFPVSNLPSLQSGLHIIGEHAPGHAVQGMDPLQSISQSQSHSLGGGLPPDSNSLQGHPYFQQTSYGLQYSGGGGVPEQFSKPEKVNSSMSSRTTPDFLERNQPSYALSFAQSRIANHFNPYSSTFDRPLSSKFKLNASTQENGTTINTKHGSSSVHVDVHNVSGVDQAQSVLPRLGGDKYDPLFDSIELASTSFSRAEHKKLETPSDSDNLPRLGGSGKVVDEEIIKHEGGIAIDSLSANDSIEHEEFGETADAEVGGVLSESLSTPNGPTNKDAGEIEIDQVKDSRKKRKGKDSKSMKLFQISIASFVKNVLKPSWRQGNMSKEAFKTIVKKTVDKVSGAMKGHHIPKSQEKITHYIDSSRGKLTKLVMGYVDKYVNP